MFSSLVQPRRWAMTNHETDSNPSFTLGPVQRGFLRCSSGVRQVFLKCPPVVLLYSVRPARTLGRAAESAGCVPVSTAPHVRCAPPGWTDPAWSGSVPSHGHTMTELQHTDTGYSHVEAGFISDPLIQFVWLSHKHPNEDINEWMSLTFSQVIHQASDIKSTTTLDICYRNKTFGNPLYEGPCSKH